LVDEESTPGRCFDRFRGGMLGSTIHLTQEDDDVIANAT
jgi:hypothetical protein